MPKLEIGVGFHAGTPAYLNGIGDYWRKIAKNGQVLFAKGTDSAGVCKEIQDLTHEYPQIEAHAIWRKSSFSWGNDVPDYNADPVAHAHIYWDQIDAAWPQELDKEFVWVEFPNEVDKNQSAWLGDFLEHAALEAIKRGYRFLSPGWATGEPEPEDWADLQAFLSLCSDYPERLGVSVHEYTLSEEISLLDAVPLQRIGRVLALNDYCESVGLDAPTVFITEFGWGANSAPVASIGVPQIIEMLEWYLANAPNVRGIALWCLDSSGQWHDLSRTINGYMQPLADAIIYHNWGEEEPDKIKFVEFLYAQEHTVDQAEQVWTSAWNPYKRTVGGSVHHAIAALTSPMASKESYVVVFDPHLPSQKEAIRLLDAYNIRHEDRTISSEQVPPSELTLGHPFSYRYHLSSPFNAERSYANKLHEGVDFIIYGSAGDSRVDVLATYEGVVEEAYSRETGYGKAVKIKHQYYGRIFYTTYAHLSQIYVVKGNTVTAGQPIGKIGSTGNSSGEHLHLSLQMPGSGLSGYIIPDVVDPIPWLRSGRESLPLFQRETRKDLLTYFIPRTIYGPMYEVQHYNGPTETFQTQVEGNEFYIVKNSQWEQLRYDDTYIWRGLDTSPGEDRYYKQFEYGIEFARWCKRFMRPGETYRGPGHSVQFYKKADCSPVPDFSGPATNEVTFVAHHIKKEWNGITVYDLIELTDKRETWFFAKDVGLVAWGIGENGSAISEWHEGRPALKKEIIGCL